MAYNDFILVGTRSSGTIILNKDFSIRHHLSEEYGSKSNFVYKYFTDLEQNVWIVSRGGIKKVMFKYPLVHFDKRSGIVGRISKSLVHKERTYFLDTYLLHELHEGKLKTYTDMPQLNRLRVFQDKVLAIGNGIFIKYSKGFKKISNQHLFASTHSRYHKNLIIGVNGKSLYLIKIQNDKTTTQKIKLKRRSYSVMVEESKTIIWLANLSALATRIDISDINNPIITDYKIPTTKKSRFVMIRQRDGKIQFPRESEAFYFDPKQNKIVQMIDPSTSDTRTNLNSLSKKIKTKIENTIGEILSVTTISDSLKWIGGSNFVLKYKTLNDTIENKNVNPVIRNIQYKKGEHYLRSPSNQFEYDQNQIRFSYSYPSFNNEELHVYQTFLEGFDTHWNMWSKDYLKEYTNLNSGNYTFKVRAKDQHGDISKEIIYSFEILKPWYLTYYSILAYIVFIFLAIRQFVRVRTLKLENRQSELEETISIRTSELNKQNKLLEQTNQYRNDFFANISHEFRTPLTLILGPVKKQLDKKIITPPGPYRSTNFEI